MPVRTILAAALALAPLVAAVPAQAHAGGRDPDGLLPSLPSHAAPGVCYARVKQSAQWSPPGPAHAHWRLTPPPPGAPGPLWCLVSEPGAPPVLIAAERSGWIRVLCDADATPARITVLQRRLHERGVYAGEATGRYDEATAAGVRRFQHERHLDHGGYLSLQTVEALEGGGGFAGPVGPPPSFAVPGGPGCCEAPPPPPPVVRIPVAVPPPPPSPWLGWPGKSRY